MRLNCPFVLHIGMFTLIDIPTFGLVRHIYGSIIPLSAQQALTSSTSFKQQDNTKLSPSTTITTHTRGPSTSCSRSHANRSPENPTEQDKDSAEIDAHTVDLTDKAAVRGVFEKYGKGGIYGVIHIAVSNFFLCFWENVATGLGRCYSESYSSS